MSKYPNSQIEKVIDEKIRLPKYRMMLKDRMIHGKTYEEIMEEYFADISSGARKKERRRLYKSQKWIELLLETEYKERRESECR